MRLSLTTFVLLALATATGPLFAQGHLATVPGEADGLPWRALAEDDDAASFVAVMGREGDVARLSSMLVFRTPVEEDGDTFDALSEAIAVHCPTRRYRREHYETASNGVRNPPPLTRLPVDPSDTSPDSFFEDPLPAGSIRDRQFRIACGERPLPGIAVTNPYRWARERFRRAGE